MTDASQEVVLCRVELQELGILGLDPREQLRVAE
jgi:hypothetical protein